jgi:hypothetical protein
MLDVSLAQTFMFNLEANNLPKPPSTIDYPWQCSDAALRCIQSARREWLVIPSHVRRHSDRKRIDRIDAYLGLHWFGSRHDCSRPDLLLAMNSRYCSS